jgi:peptidoglycan-N-acetylglucosamine deacetylase
MTDKHPSFSVIIPAYNEKDYIADCVRSLKRQDYKGNFEIIVVDNASTDGTAKIAEEAGAKVVCESEKNVSRARRKGSSEALGEILAYTDADSQPPSDWISRFNSIFVSDKEIVAAGGIFRFDEVGFTVNLLANKIFLPVNGLVMKYFITPRVPFLTGSNMAVKRGAYEKCGGFDPKFPYGEDNELATRLAKLGKVFFDPDLIVKTSFRRYSGGHKSIFFVLPKAIKETFVTIYRFFLLKSRNKAFSAQSAIRENNSGAPEENRNEKRKVVSLTFDDGPYGKATEKILDILKEKGVKATFFLLGKNAEKYPEILQREIEEGHIVGNHSFDHSRMLPLKTSKQFMENVTKAEIAIGKASGLRPKFFRFPFGIGTPWLKKSLKSQSYTLIPLGIMTNDYNAKTKPEKISAYVLKRLEPGSIITLHDGRDIEINYPRENISKALPKIIDGIRDAGYAIVPLEEMMRKDPYF